MNKDKIKEQQPSRNPGQFEQDRKTQQPQRPGQDRSQTEKREDKGRF